MQKRKNSLDNKIQEIKNDLDKLEQIELIIQAAIKAELTKEDYQKILQRIYEVIYG